MRALVQGEGQRDESGASGEDKGLRRSKVCALTPPPRCKGSVIAHPVDANTTRIRLMYPSRMSLLEEDGHHRPAPTALSAPSVNNKAILYNKPHLHQLHLSVSPPLSA